MVPKISEELKQDIEQGISTEEIAQAMKEMDKDKVPGPDGIPIEFYREFKDKLQPMLNQIIVEFSERWFTINQGRGIISLIDKPGKNMLKIKDWRPLSLLNVDMKIYSKVLANRLYKALPAIIHHDQTAFLKGRYIGENLLDLITIIEHCNQKGVDGLLVAVDFEKAFDTFFLVKFFQCSVILQFWRKLY